MAHACESRCAHTPMSACVCVDMRVGVIIEANNMGRAICLPQIFCPCAAALRAPAFIASDPLLISDPSDGSDLSPPRGKDHLTRCVVFNCRLNFSLSARWGPPHC
jgi:hypothetical protein